MSWFSGNKEKEKKNVIILKNGNEPLLYHRFLGNTSNLKLDFVDADGNETHLFPCPDPTARNLGLTKSPRFVISGEEYLDTQIKPVEAFPLERMRVIASGGPESARSGGGAMPSGGGRLTSWFRSLNPNPSTSNIYGEPDWEHISQLYSHSSRPAPSGGGGGYGGGGGAMPSGGGGRLTSWFRSLNPNPPPRDNENPNISNFNRWGGKKSKKLRRKSKKLIRKSKKSRK
jgi:hypothetical protein